MDGTLYGSVVREGIGKPFLFLLSDHRDALTPQDRRAFADIRSATRRAPCGKFIVTLIGARHFSFGDRALMQSRIVRSVHAAIGGAGSLDARTGLASTARYVRQFFEFYLRAGTAERSVEAREAAAFGPPQADQRLADERAAARAACNAWNSPD